LCTVALVARLKYSSRARHDNALQHSARALEPWTPHIPRPAATLCSTGRAAACTLLRGRGVQFPVDDSHVSAPTVCTAVPAVRVKRFASPRSLRPKLLQHVSTLLLICSKRSAADLTRLNQVLLCIAEDAKRAQQPRTAAGFNSHRRAFV
jgi:hypothetical protein